MKILMFGRGVIATTYAWALEKSGNQVEFYVRPGKSAQYGPFVNLEILDGRMRSKGALIKAKWPITMREELSADHDYDLIIVSVNHNQFSEAATFLSSRIGKATVLIFNNMWDEPQKVVSSLPQEQLVWGFPGGGGGFDANTLKSGFMKTIYMGSVGDSNHTARYQSVRELFHKAGFSVSEPKDFRSWLWFHFVLNAGLAAQTLKVGGYINLLNSSAHIKESILLMREMLPLLKAKGDKPSRSVVFLLNLPAGLTGFVMQKFLGGDNLPNAFMKLLESTGHSSYELTSLYPRDVLTDARRLGVRLPRLAALESVFK
ncbi:ketopantoate reductase family protein [Clostridium aminobutyricum]|uniref:Ketopantoate reductase n=1 Tax=Clostridium aminobutyricum TaxID=33953 RepID=A0A939D9I3_CLOAM|nr:2-dehydropantoate 2-reductase N-terminal domain-containing protein [Clostridium aminobutyricum]MBN7773585.1 ketopantoate reductase [Clostridium aminobutyricum]